jgi:hypothetical protein
MHISGIIVPINVIGLVYLTRSGDYFSYGKNFNFGLACYFDDVVYLFVYTGIPFWLSLLSILINYGRIYKIVRKSLPANESSEQLAGPTTRRKRLKKEVTILMILYVGSFFVTWTPSFVWLFFYFDLGYGYGTTTMRSTYPLRLLVAATLPLQGFLNAFIYFKPAYARFRTANPTKSVRFVLYQTLFNRTAPKSNYRHRNAQHVTHGSLYGHNITDITLTDPSRTEASASNPIAEEDEGVGITGIDFESTLFVNEEDAPAESNDSPLEAVAEENDDSLDSDS